MAHEEKKDEDIHNNIVNIAIGRRIQRYRNKAGMTQEKLAEKIGITQKHLSRIENGYHTPQFDTVISLAKILDVPIEAFAEDCMENNSNIFLQLIKSDIAGLSQKKLEMVREIIASVKKFDK